LGWLDREYSARCESLRQAHSSYRRYRRDAVYESGWRFDDAGHLIVEIRIPFNASALIVLPDVHMGELSLNSHPLYEGEQIGSNMELTLGASAYRFEYFVREKDAHAELEASPPESTGRTRQRLPNSARQAGPAEHPPES
jgi:hypothetical protein